MRAGPGPVRCVNQRLVLRVMPSGKRRAAYGCCKPYGCVDSSDKQGVASFSQPIENVSRSTHVDNANPKIPSSLWIWPPPLASL